ncbi:Programmed cell death toxin MazE (plasmid) [Rhodovulum sp. P5]|uniref:PIN domain-containing protein n=1 Tax=Rhodovulum sp. P5 TaxID=1564506 RepID=UPI0009C24BAA|nr:PIN domain-containing protein [Rhodovulum sp. P5]ARE42414.1 Programmed cell death toxin MazE [Rhodovulum sp. P5]
MTDRFFDTNVLLYLLSPDRRKAEIARTLVARGGTISVQVLGELTNVARRKAGLEIDEIAALTGTLRDLLDVVPMTEEIFDGALQVARQTGYATFDCLIVSAALSSGARSLYTEDMQAGREIGGLKLINPFEER